MITGDALKDAGYTPFVNDQLMANNQFYKRSFQKPFFTMIEPRQLRFYINFDVYDLSNVPESGNSFVVSCMAQFFKDNSFFNVELIITPSHTVEEVDQFYSDVYDKLNCEMVPIPTQH